MMTDIDWHELIVEKRIIGCGSYGDVYKALWKSKDGKLDVVVKKFGHRQSDIEINKEVKHLALTNHDNIVKLYGTSIDVDKRIVMVMEYAECGSIYDVLYKKSLIIPYTRKISWMLQCAKGIGYLHGLSHTILHRDLKPHNMLIIDQYRTLKICDFGTVKPLVAIMSYGVGTTPYMAPEVSELDSYTEKCDVYSFGMTFWEVMSKKKPFSHLGKTNEYFIQRKAYEGERPPVRDIQDFENSEQIAELIEKCWKGDPSLRPTMLEVIELLDTFNREHELENLDLHLQITNVIKGIEQAEEHGSMEVIPNSAYNATAKWEDIELQEIIGFGSFGDVIKATWRTGNGMQLIAVKRYRINFTVGQAIWLRQIARLKHENIITIYGVTEDDDSRTVILMEYANCGTLESIIHSQNLSNQHCSYYNILIWMLQCVEGMAYLHRQNVIHRDLNTKNLLLTNNFQSLKIVNTESVEMGTMMTNMFGTASYMAPEVFRGEKYADKCDVYSFGILLWEVMSRKRPYYDFRKSNLYLLMKVEEGYRPTITDIKSYKESYMIQELIIKCWEKDPMMRPSMNALVSYFENRSFVMGDAKIIETVKWKDIKLQKIIGSGRFSDVIKATWRTENGMKLVAAKRYRNDFSVGQAKWLRQTRRLEHGNIVMIYGVTKDDDNRIVILMEYADCGTIESVVHSQDLCNQHYTYFNTLIWMLQCVEGMAYLHGQNIIHRSLGTKKLLLTNHFQSVKILITEPVTIGTTGSYIDTASYIPPEVCILFTASAFYYGSFVLMKVATGGRPPTSDINSFRHTDLIIELITQCWAEDPSIRPSMNYLISSIAQILHLA